VDYTYYYKGYLFDCTHTYKRRKKRYTLDLTLIFLRSRINLNHISLCAFNVTISIITVSTFGHMFQTAAASVRIGFILTQNQPIINNN